MSSRAFVLEHAPQLAKSIRRRTVSDLVADKLAGMIASGTLQVGDELPSERELAAALQVSRETVRSGIRTLTTLGALDVSQGARTRVVSADIVPEADELGEARTINDYALEDIHRTRLAIERPLVGDAAERIDERSLELLERSLAAQAEALDDPVRFIILDREFHRTLYRAGGNPVLADFVTDLYGYIMSHRRRAIAAPGAIAKSRRDHELIVQALGRRDRRAAMRAIRTHLERIHDTTRTLLDEPALSASTGSPTRRQRT